MASKVRRERIGCPDGPGEEQAPVPIREGKRMRMGEDFDKDELEMGERLHTYVVKQCYDGKMQCRWEYRALVEFIAARAATPSLVQEF